MNKFTMFIIGLLVSSYLNAQNILYVNNNNGAAQEHLSTLAAAVDSASNGDIIYLQPSATSYGSATLDKQLTIYGSGHSISANPELGISTILHNCTATTLTFNSGSEGSVVSGLRFNRLYSNSVSNLKIKRNEVINGLILDNSDSTIVEGCYFSNTANTGGTVDDYNIVMKNGANDILVINNIFNYGTNAGQSSNTGSIYSDNLRVYSGCSAIVSNNIFRDNVYVDNSFVFNNIFIHAQNSNSANELTASTSTVQSNIFSTNETAFATDNIINYGVDSIFVGYPSSNGFSFDARYRLSSNSPAIGYANDGGDCGVFDDSNKYRLSGVPNTPVLSEYNIPNVIPSNGQLNLIIQARTGG